MGKKREHNEAVILQAAIKCLGTDKDTIEEIAKEAGLPKANVHYYFKGKENLVKECMKKAESEPLTLAALFMLLKQYVHAGDVNKILQVVHKWNVREVKTC